jgi:hypothetical protein
MSNSSVLIIALSSAYWEKKKKKKEMARGLFPYTLGTPCCYAKHYFHGC